MPNKADKLPESGKNGPQQQPETFIKADAAHCQSGGVTQPDISPADGKPQHQKCPDTAQHKQAVCQCCPPRAQRPQKAVPDPQQRTQRAGCGKVSGSHIRRRQPNRRRIQPPL